MPPRGRPRSFDVERALDQALKVFWSKGYEGASLPDLTEAMGINRPSLYAAFGNKESLFRRVMDRYADRGRALVAECESEPTARAFVERYPWVRWYTPVNEPLITAMFSGHNGWWNERGRGDVRVHAQEIEVRVDRPRDVGADQIVVRVSE